MKKLFFVLCIFLNLVFYLYSQEEKIQVGLKSYFVRGVVWPWELTESISKKTNKEYWKFVEETFKKLKELNCNCVWFLNTSEKDATKLADIAERYDIKILPTLSLIYELNLYGFSSIDDVRSKAEDCVKILGNKKSVAGYVLVDQPRRLWTKHMEFFRQILKEIDPSRDSIVCTMNVDTETYANQTNFPVLCVDCYPFGGDGSPNVPNPAYASQRSYRYILNNLKKEADKTKKSIWVIAGAFAEVWGPWWYDKNMNVVLEPGCYLNVRMTTIEETRWEIWEAIRNCYKGVLFFSLLPPINEWDGKGEVPIEMIKSAEYVKNTNWPVLKTQIKTENPMALFYINGTPTPQMKEIGKVFSELSKIENIIINFEKADFPVCFSDTPFSVSTLKSNVSPYKRYVCVVNDELKQTLERKVFFLPNVSKVKELISDKNINLEMSPIDNLKVCNLKLEPGSGTILEVEFIDNQPGFVLFEENFSSLVLGVKLKNLVRQPVKRTWATGWDWIIQKEKNLPPEAKGVITLDRISEPKGLTGGILHPNTKFDVYMFIEGNFSAPESIIVEGVEKNDKVYCLKSNNYHLPIQIPYSLKNVDITISDGIMIDKILLWAIPKTAIK